MEEQQKKGKFKSTGHKYCIIFDAFRTATNDEYVPKKCSVYDITTGSNICTYFVAPPYPWEQLNATSRNVNSFLSRYLIGAGWYDGNITYEQFIMNMLRHSETASQIFTKGLQCQKYLMKILGRPVVDIEPLLKELSTESVEKIKSQLPTVNCAYMDHTRKFFVKEFNDPFYTCCQNRAFLYGNLVRYYLRNTGHRELNKQVEQMTSSEHINTPKNPPTN